MRRLLPLLVVFLVTPANATDYILRDDGLGAFPTIQDAVIGAADGDTISLWDGVYSGEGNRNVDLMGKALLVRSVTGDSSACVVDCLYQGRGFVFESGEDSTTVLQGVTVTNGYVITNGYGGAVLIAGASPKFLRCAFEYNVAGEDGGAMFVDGGSPSISMCRFQGNEAFHDAGALSLTNGGRLQDCSFVNNEAHNDCGAIQASAGDSLAILDSSFEDNAAWNEAGAVGIAAIEDVRILGSSFDSNSCSDGRGGAILANYEAYSLRVEDCQFVGNSAEGRGGAVYSAHDLEVRNCGFIANSSGATGGGLFVSDGFRMETCLLQGNMSDESGGGVYCFSFDEIVDCDFFENSAWGAGGGAQDLWLTRRTPGGVYVRLERQCERGCCYRNLGERCHIAGDYLLWTPC